MTRKKQPLLGSREIAHGASKVGGAAGSHGEDTDPVSRDGYPEYPLDQDLCSDEDEADEEDPFGHGFSID